MKVDAKKTAHLPRAYRLFPSYILGLGDRDEIPGGGASSGGGRREVTREEHKRLETFSYMNTCTTCDVQEHPLLDEKQAATWLNCSVAALRKWRHHGQEPVFCRIGRLVRYSIEDLRAFVEGHRVTTTNQDGEGDVA